MQVMRRHQVVAQAGRHVQDPLRRAI
jgi:hypothetical protein